MPCTKLPHNFHIEVVLRAVSLMNSLPRKDGIHSTLSPREIVTGKKFRILRYNIGDYVQAYMSYKMNNDMTKEKTVDALYLGPSNDDDGHNVFTLSTKQKVSVNKISMIPITTDVVDKVTNIGKDEDQPGNMDFTSMLSNINAHNNEISVNWKISTKDTLGTTDTFYDIWEDSDSNTGNSEVGLNSDTKDSKMYNRGLVVENPEVHKVNNHLPEEVGEVPEEEVGSMEVTT